MVEMLDVLDETGKPTGIAKTKTEILQAGDWRKVVHIWVVDSAKRLLFQKRAPGIVLGGLLDVSVGGGVTSGEPSLLTAVRELKEELGLVCTPEELKLLGTWKMPPKPMGSDGVMKDFSDTYLLRRDLDPTALTLQPREVATAGLLSLAAFRRDIQDSTIYAQWVPHGVNYYVDVATIILEQQ